MTIETFEKEVEAVKVRYQPEIDQIEKDGKALEDEALEPNAVEALIDVDFSIEWKDEKISFDVPTVIMKTKDISFDVPEVSMRTKKISFDVPAVRMKKWCVAKVPQGFPLKMKCIIAEKPEPYMRRQEIKIDLPKVVMKTKSISIDIPEFSMRTTSIILTLPHITVRKMSLHVKNLKSKGDLLKARGQDVADRMKSDIDGLIAKHFGSFSSDETSIAQSAEEAYDSAISQVSSAINDLKSHGIDPIKVPTDEGDVNVRKMLVDMIDEKNKSLLELDLHLGTGV